MRKSKLIEIKNRQDGLAAIFVTLVMMIVISLIVIGFVQISNRERGESLDRQLSTEAFYAAETGVNEVKDIFLAQGFNSALNKTSCPSTNSIYSPSQQIDDTNSDGNGQDNVNVTCVLVNTTPSQAVYQNVQSGQYIVGNIDPTSNDGINTIDIYWQAATMPSAPNFDCIGSGTFPQGIADTCQSGAGVLRVDLVPGNSLTSDTVVYLYPTSATANNTVKNVATSDGRVLNVYCHVSTTQPEDCEAKLKVTVVATEPQYYYRVEPLYQDASTNLLAFDGSTQENLSDNQIQVDSTGQAQNVLQRLQAYLSLDNNDGQTNNITPPNQPPSNGLQTTGSICKDFYYDGTNDTDTLPQNASCPSFP